MYPTKSLGKIALHVQAILPIGTHFSQQGLSVYLNHAATK